jgi:exocyst complex component 7
MEGICVAEYENIIKIFPSEEQGRTLEATCRPALTEFSKTLRELNQYIKAHILTDCFLAYEIIEIVTPLSYRLEAKTGELKAQFTEALRPIRETAKSSLTELLEDTRKRASTIAALPTDGGPIPFTNDVMSRLQNLALYSSPVTSILTSLGDGNWRGSAAPAQRPALDVSPDGATLLSHYLLDTLDALLSGLESRAKSFHRTKQLQGVFLANNLAIIDRGLRSSPDLNTYFSKTEHSSRLDPWRKKGPSLFLDAWREPSSFLLDVQYTNRPSNTPRPQSGTPVDSAAIIKGLTSKDKDAIKDKFKSFNSSFEELVARQKSLYMEREVRANLAKEVQAMIEPLYARFWDRYHDIDKKGKYVKFDKGALGAHLATLA